MEAEIGGEYRVYGPPGCGKTTWLSRQIARAAQARGSDEVFVASFTKTAAVELIGRNLPISDKAVGTLHSHCYRAIGDPTIAEVHVEDFNEEFPHYALSSSAKGKMDEAAVDSAAGDTDADALLNQYNILRNKMIPKDQWSPEVLGFAQAWESFKDGNDLLDFTDLIETAYKNFDTPLNAPTIGFIDECQDLTPLQFELVRKWGRTMERLILVGDPDQCIFSFTGASVEPFITPIAEGNKRVLAQSYRVPRKPHALALKWIRRCSKRQDVEYYPTEVEGAVKRNTGTYQKPGPILDAAEQELAAGKSVMLLTNCSYQLQHVIAELRRRGLPFHNPYRTSRGDWNPLARRKGWRASDRLLAFLEPAGPEYFLDTGEAMGPINRYWTPAQLGAWTELCKTRGLLNKGARDLIKETIGRTNDMSPGEMENFIFDAMDIDAIPEALRLDYKWLLSKLSAAKIKSLDFPVAILESQGREALREEPRIIVGTVHSVKGGEASTVLYMPDISLASWKYAQECATGRDSLIRQGYVAFTRCRETLVLCSPCTKYHMGMV